MENVRKLALYLVLGFAILGGLITVNQSLSDHGNLFSFIFTAAWLFPMVIGCWLAWRRPMIAFPLLMIWSMSVLGLLIWQALAPSWWNTILNSDGPIITTAMFALTAPLAIYGYQRRTRFVAVILIGLSVLNMMATANTDANAGSTLKITIPVLGAGILYLIASFVDKRDDSVKEK
ncbi:MAG: hypothetical protein WCQ11_05860 [Actinomycetes bacterium]